MTHEPPERITVFILAAGFSSRMGRLKPLLPFPEEPLILRQIGWLRAAGVRDIRAVTGHSEELLRPLLARAGVRQIVNERYADGMFTSVRAAVRDLLDCPLNPAVLAVETVPTGGQGPGHVSNCGLPGGETARIDSNASACGFAILPADYPLLYPVVIAEILEHADPAGGKILFPCFNGERGHPPVIPASLAPAILGYDGPGGLAGFLESAGIPGVDFETGCPGVVADIDTPADYETALLSYRSFQRPSRDVCERLLDRYGVSPVVRAHSEAVAAAAGTLAALLEEKGVAIDRELTVSAALLHDIAKGSHEHADEGAAIARYHGLDEIAPLIAEHMDFMPDDEHLLGETAILYLADKCVEGELRVSLPERMEHSLKRYTETEAREHILRRFSVAIRISEAVKALIGEDPLCAIERENPVGVCGRTDGNVGKNDLSPQAL